jgi:hypothetical protein
MESTRLKTVVFAAIQTARVSVAVIASTAFDRKARTARRRSFAK